LNANKPVIPGPKQGKVTASQLNNNKYLKADLKKEEPSFFGSFFSSAKSQGKEGPTGVVGTTWALADEDNESSQNIFTRYRS
jgi:hypothetical protein